MSVFFKNNCQFNTCKKGFNTLKDLIIHIENEHLDFDPYKIEQLEDEKPETIPMSYVLKFGTFDDVEPQYSETDKNDMVLCLNESVIEPEISTIKDVGTSINNNYLGCDIKHEKVKSMKNNDLKGKEEVSLHLLGNQKLFTMDNSHKKPFGCNMPGCEKRYKNVNGIKYHYKKHHKLCTSGDTKAVFTTTNQTPPPFKKSVLKYKSLLNKPRINRNLLGMPLLSCTPQKTDLVYHGHNRFEENELPPGDYFYKYTMPTSDFHVANQVPLSTNTMSFNYYNISDGDIEDFSEKNSNVFVPSFDKL